MKPPISELCRKSKDTMNPRKTNQDLADGANVSLNSVANFLRGNVPNPSVYMVGSICRDTHVSLDEYFDIRTGQTATSEELLRLLNEVQQLRAENQALHEKEALYEKSLRMHRFTTGVLLCIVAAAAIALLIDALNPNVGWIRTALDRTQQVIQGVCGTL